MLLGFNRLFGLLRKASYSRRRRRRSKAWVVQPKKLLFPFFSADKCCFLQMCWHGNCARPKAATRRCSCSSKLCCHQSEKRLGSLFWVPSVEGRSYSVVPILEISISLTLWGTMIDVNIGTLECGKIIWTDFIHIWIFPPKWLAIFTKIDISACQVWLKLQFYMLEIVKNPSF